MDMSNSQIVAVLGISAAMALASCTSSTPDDPACGPPHPTFHLEIDAQPGSVPEDVTITLVYGGGEETFRVGGNKSLKVLLCEARRGDLDGGLVDESRNESGNESGDGSDDGPADEPMGDPGPISSVYCDLWTNGAATVSVSAERYLGDSRHLEAELDPECGLIQMDVRITLVSVPK